MLLGSNSQTMTLRSILLWATISLLAPFGSAQSPSVDRTEILGRLAKGYSPSFISHLVETRGINFSLTDSLLSQVRLAGGDGILVERLSSLDSAHRGSSSAAEPGSIDHLAKCTELIHTGATLLAESECRASVDENDKSPWPLLIVADLAMNYATGRDGSIWDEEKEAEVAELQRRATLLDSQRLTNTVFESAIVPPYMFFVNGQTDTQPEMGGELAASPIDPELASDHRSLAYRYFKSRDFENAQRELREAIRLEPDNADLHTSLAFLFVSADDRNAAISELREAVRIAPYNASHRESLSKQLEELGRTSEAIAELKSFLVISPESMEPSRTLVELCLRHKDMKSAIAELQRSLKATFSTFSDQSKFVEIRYSDIDQLGYLLRQNQQVDAATEQYLLILRFQPDNAYAHNNYANLLMEQHRIDEALAEFNEALRLEPDMPTAHHNIGLCLAQKKNLDGAISEYRQTLELDPNQPNTRNLLGIALAQKGDLSGAMEQFQLSIDKDPNDTSARISKAFALTQHKDFSGAIQELKNTLKIDPESADAQNDLAWIYATADDLKLRNPAEALVLAKEAVSGSATPNPAFLDTLAEALLMNGQPVEAITIETQAAQLDPQNPNIQSRLERFRVAAESAQTAKP